MFRKHKKKQMKLKEKKQIISRKQPYPEENQGKVQEIQFSQDSLEVAKVLNKEVVVKSKVKIRSIESIKEIGRVCPKLQETPISCI